MRYKHLQGVCWILLVGACGGDGPASPFELAVDFPVVSTFCHGTPAAARYMILGLSNRVVDPNAVPPLEASIRIGDTVRLRLEQGPPPGSDGSCGSTSSEVWTSTNPAVASVSRDSFTFAAHLRAHAPGTFSVFVDFTGSDQARHRTTLAYCEADANHPGFPGTGSSCSDPRKIGVVAVAL